MTTALFLIALCVHLDAPWWLAGLAGASWFVEQSRWWGQQ